MKKLGWLLVGLFSLSAVGAEKDPRPDMHKLAAEISALQKFMFTESEFSLPANDAAIRKSIGSLESHLEHLGQGTFADDPALKANLSMLRQHVSDASRAFRENGKPFARYMLQSSLQMCIACHTRKKAADFAWPEPEASQIPALDQADYYFATRQFKKGAAIYEKIVAESAGKRGSHWDVRRSLLSLAVYYARVVEDPAAGAAYFSGLAERQELAPYLREEMKAWGKEFRAWSKEKPGAEPGKSTESALVARAKQLLRHDDFSLANDPGRSFHVRRLRAASLLQAALEAPGGKSPVKGDALLLLGQIYPKISSSLFFRFGEMYLKTCIQDYPKSKLARSCYVALEQTVTDGYSGSGGTDVPEAEQVELMRLHRIAY